MTGDSHSFCESFAVQIYIGIEFFFFNSLQQSQIFRFQSFITIFGLVFFVIAVPLVKPLYQRINLVFKTSLHNNQKMF